MVAQSFPLLKLTRDWMNPICSGEPYLPVLRTSCTLEKLSSNFVAIFSHMTYNSDWKCVLFEKSKKLFYTPFSFVSSIFYQVTALQELWKKLLFHIKRSFHSLDVRVFVIFSLLFHISQIWKDQRRRKDLWCHKLACIN